MAVDITLSKEKYRSPKPSGNRGGGSSSTGKKKIKKTQGTGNRRKAYGPF